MKYADGPTTQGTVLVAAPPERVWELVSDIHLVASLSAEVQEVEWLDGVTGAAAGSRFRGRNRHPAIGEWATVSHVVACEPPRTFAWDVHGPANPSASWRFELTPCEGGTELRQWARLGPGPSGLTSAIERMPEKEERIVAGRLREFRAGIESNLAALKEMAEKA
jgi:uncharacterized protein YndB with AHSA1/START domain